MTGHYVCRNCGVDRTCKPSVAKSRVYCSMRCKSQYMTGRVGPAARRWNGGRFTDKDGYYLVSSPTHPHADSKGYVREHRLVLERSMGRLLNPAEDVHHLDGNKQNNSPDNLELFPDRSTHIRTRHHRDNSKSWFRPKGSCLRGHLLSGGNLYVRPDGTAKGCRTCRAIAVKKHILKKEKVLF